jgi:hypothetical protein
MNKKLKTFITGLAISILLLPINALAEKGDDEMAKYREYALTALQKLTENGITKITNDDLIMLEEKANETNQKNKRLGELYESIFYGFFACAAEGIALYPEEKVVQRFGQPIKDNYPEANDVFLRFAKTYWTLRTLEYDLLENNQMDWLGGHLLGKLEQDIGPVFFPFPGPAKISPTKREQFQRELLEEFGKDIDIDKFMEGNPILIRDRESSLWWRIKNIFNR